MPPPVGDLRMETFPNSPRPGERAKRSAWAGMPWVSRATALRPDNDFHKAERAPRQYSRISITGTASDRPGGFLSATTRPDALSQLSLLGHDPHFLVILLTRTRVGDADWCARPHMRKARTSPGSDGGLASSVSHDTFGSETIHRA
jgi:hypothetical protein